MENSRFKRNVIALLIAVPIISALSFLTSLFDGGDDSYDWDFSFGPHGHNFGSSDSRERLVDLRGEWRFAVGDDAARAQREFDDSHWETVRVPDYWESQGFTNHDGFGWYRKNFVLNADDIEGRQLQAAMGFIDDVDEVYINGQVVGGRGQFPPTYTGAWDQYRDYPIPQGVLHEGENTIAVRVYDAQMGGGIYKGDPGIYKSAYPAPLINLEGEWQFSLDGSSESSTSIQVPAAWEHQGYADYDGIAIYKKEFGELELRDDKQLVLLLGRIDDTDEVTLNGELIGRTGKLNDSDRNVDPHYYRIERQYEFPSSLLRKHNVLEVRVHDSGGEGGIYEGPVAIMSKRAFEQYLNEKARG